MSSEICEYTLILDSPPKSLGYWPNGIGEAGPGNDHMVAAQEKRWRGDVDALRSEHAVLIKALKDAGVPTVIIPYPKEELFVPGGLTQDVEFFRDPTICHPKSSALLLNMGAPNRNPEVRINQAVYEALGIPCDKMNFGNHEGGNTRCIDINGTLWYFSATSTRSNPDGLNAIRGFLGDNCIVKHLFLDVLNGLHLDCIFNGFVDPDTGKVTFFAWMDGFSKKSRKDLEQTTRNLDGDLFCIDQNDADRLVPNSIQRGNHVFYSGKFKNRVHQQFLDERFSTHYTPLKQNLELGGAVHCLTREVFTQEPINPKTATGALHRTGFFPLDSRIVVHNNY